MESLLLDRRARPDWLLVDAIPAGDGWPLRRFRAEPEGAARGSILFQTGRADFFEKYIEAIAHWRGRGWSIEGFDWRGQGGSGRLHDDPRIGHTVSYDVHVADLAHYNAAWRERSPGPHILIGHSMGGHLILRMLAEKGAVTDAAVLLSPMLGLNMGPLPESFARVIARVACGIGLSGRAVWSEPGLGSGHRQRNLTRSIERFEDELYWRSRNEMLDLGPPSWGWIRESLESIALLKRPGMLERIAVPLLLLYAEADGLVQSQATRAAAKRLPNARVLGRLDAAHELLREADPVRCWAEREIDSFVETLR